MDTDEMQWTALTWPPGPSPKWEVRFEWAPIRGRLECIGVSVTSSPRRATDWQWWPAEKRRDKVKPKPFRTQVWREIPIQTLIDEHRPQALENLRFGATVGNEWAVRHAEQLGIRIHEVEDEDGDPAIVVTGPDETKFLRVAEVYAAAWKGSSSPVVAVAKDQKVARSTAGRYVSIARNQYGYLVPAQERQANGRLTKKAKRLLKSKRQED
jgi:hypothetical protein